MSFEKVVIQKKLDDGSYIEDYPRTSQEMILNLLNSSTKSLMGLEESATADDAFKQLYLANVLNGKSMVELTFLDSETNKPLSGVVVTCDKFCDAAGTALTEHTTDSNGKIVAFVSAINPTIKVTGYADIENFSQQLGVPVLGKQFVFNFNLTTNQFKSYLSSQTVKFSKNVTRVDVSSCGGGRAGFCRNYSGAGGGGGFTTQAENVVFSSEINYNIVIGSGGTPAYNNDGGDGGTSSFLGVEAMGGSGGKSGASHGANGNGLGAYYNYPNYINGTDGTQTIYSSFISNVICGGGGGGSLNDDDDTRYASAGKPGGADNNTYSKNGTDGIGGGGMRYYTGRTTPKQGRGRSGQVAIRMYLTSRL